MNSFADRGKFLLRFFRSPLRIGSVTPSSRQLVQAMLEPISWNEVRIAVELGAGTGVVTRELKRWLPSDAKMFIFEKDPALQIALRQDYPEFYHVAEAEILRGAMKNRGVAEADVIFSSLPFANFSEDARASILDQVRDGLTQNGVFTAYQYTPQMKRLLGERFRDVRVRFVPWNLPPAFIYICREPIR
ncbi:class I SAM-dependent methyltransferase [Kroppenstedtia sanguinis]|uniref:Class I SAM-dependent methyltransferase n=1 Tax=Kroppenstedtia sanguinis TaxID=1380684 RepID=A0ABW4CDQ1_9BACL